MVLKVKTDMGVKQHIKRNEYYLETDKDVDYHVNWKQCFQGKISKEINRGSFGAVFRARTADNMHCAIKKPHPHILSFEESLEGYKTEIKIHSTLKHPSIVAFYGVCYIENHLPPLMIMERMWTSLYSFIEQKLLGDFPLSLKLHILLDVANGLSYLHSQNIIHRDLTLSNILLTTDLKAKISDFGGAQKVDATKCNSDSCLIPGNFLYMPPEAFASNPVCSPKLDVFSFGCNILCIINETIPCNQDQFSKVSITEKYLKSMPSEHPLLRELAASCLNYEPENRPDIKCILAVLITIISSICIVSSNKRARKTQKRCISGVRKADVNIANIAIRKWLKELKEHESSKTIRCYEILISSNSVVDVFKHNMPESGQQMWLHNLAAKFDYALTEIYSTHLETFSFYYQSCFLKSSFTQPNNSASNLNTLSNNFSSSYKAITTTANTHVTYFVAFSQSPVQSSLKQTNDIVVSSSITVSTVTKRKSSTACTVPTEFNVLLLNSSGSKLYPYVPQRRHASQVSKVSLGEIKYRHSTIRSLHTEAVLYIQPQVIFEEMFTNREEKLALENSTSLVCSQQWVNFSGSAEHLIKPSLLLSNPKIDECTNEVVKVVFINTLSSCAVGNKATLATHVCSKVSCNTTDNFGFHAALILQGYQLCSYQHTVYIYYAQLIIAYQTMKRHTNVLLCIVGFCGSCFSANGVHMKFWSAQYTYCTLFDHVPNINGVHKINFMRSLGATYACKINAQHKLEAYWISELMSVNGCDSSQLTLPASLDSFSLLDSQSYIGSGNLFQVRDDCTGAEAATSISLCANGDSVMKTELYAMPRQPGINRQQETPLGLSLSKVSSNDLTNCNMPNINRFNYNHMNAVSCKGIHWYESLYVWLIRQREIVLNHNEQPALTIQANISKHIHHQLHINLCNGQAIVNALCIRLQYSFTSHIVQRKENTILSINVLMHAFSYALSPYMLERFCEVVVPCLNMLSWTSCIFPCQHTSMLFKRYSVSLTDSVISYQPLEITFHIFSNGWKKTVKLCKNSLPVSPVFDTKESNVHESFNQTLKFILNTNVEVVPIRQIKDGTSQQECLVTSPAKEASGKCDEMKFSKELDEWLFLQNFVRVYISHNACRVFTLILLPKSYIPPSKLHFSGSPLGDNYLCQEILSTESTQTLAKHDSFHCEIESYGEGYGHASMSTRSHHCKSSYRNLHIQHIQVEHPLQCNMHSCKMQALTVTCVIKCADQLLCIVYSCQISAKIVMERSWVMLNKQYIFSYQEFNAGKNTFETLTGFSDIHNNLQINLQNKKCSWFIANGMVLEMLHQSDVYLFYNVSQLEIHSCTDNCVKSAALCPSVDLLLVDQVSVSPQSSISRDDKFKITIGNGQQSQTTMNLEKALTGAKEHLTSSHQDKQSALTTTTCIKQLTTFRSNPAKKCTYHLTPSVSSCVAYHNLKNATDQCTGNEGLKEALLVPSVSEFKKDVTMIGSSCYFNKMLCSLPQAICCVHGTLINHQCNAFVQSKNKIIQPMHDNVAVALTEENQDNASHTSDKHNNSNSAMSDDDQRIGKNFNTQENKRNSCRRSNRQKRDSNESDKTHDDDDDNHDKNYDLKPALFIVLSLLRFLLLLLLLCYIWLYSPSRLLSQLTIEHHIPNDVIVNGQLPDMSNDSIRQLIEVGWIDKKCHYSISKLHFTPLLIKGTTQTFLESNLHFDKDKQISTVNGKPVISLSPLCSIAVFHKSQLLTAIKYISYQLQVWNLGIECLHCNTTVALIFCEERLQPITLKTPRMQRLIPLLQLFYMIFTNLNQDVLSRKQFYFDAARSGSQISMVKNICITSMLDREGITCLYDEINMFDHDLCYSTHEFSEAMHEFLKQICHHYRTVTFGILSQPSMLQCSSNDETLENTVFSYKLLASKRYDTFAQSYNSVTQTNKLYIVHTMFNNENHGSNSQNYAKSSNSNISKLEYNQNFSTHNKENRSCHSNKNTGRGNNHDKEKDFNPLYFLSLFHLLLILLSVDILIIFELLSLSFEHQICNEITLVNNSVFKECIRNNKKRHELIPVMLIIRKIYQQKPQAILDDLQHKLCRKNKLLCIIVHCKVLPYSNTLMLQVWNFSAVYYQATTSFNTDNLEKLYLKVISKQGLILSQEWFDMILFDYKKIELKFIPQCQATNTISKFHDVNKMIHHLMDNDILSRFLLLRIHRWIFHIENNTHKHSMLEVYTFLMQWVSNFSLYENRISHQSLSNYRRHVCYELTSHHVNSSRNISRSGNEDSISHCSEESMVDILGSQNTLLHSTRTVPTLTTKNRVDMFRPTNIASGRTINYYSYQGSEDDKDMFDTWELVIGHHTLYNASGIQPFPNEQYHEIIYGNNVNAIMNFEVNEIFDIVIPPEQPDLGNNYNDNIVILVSL